MLKFTILLRRNPKLSHEQFLTHHKRHAALFTSLPDEIKKHIRRYVQCHATGDQIPGVPEMTFDGAVEFWFDDLNGLFSVLGSEDYQTRIRPDEQEFLDMARCEFLLSTESVVIPETAVG